MKTPPALPPSQAPSSTPSAASSAAPSTAPSAPPPAALKIHFPPDLPVSARRAEIEAAMRAHQVVIVCGETGSGKTTQLPKMALALGRGRPGQDGRRGKLIGHTQPRRIAATSVAKRITEELQTPLGEIAGTTGVILWWKE